MECNQFLLLRALAEERGVGKSIRVFPNTPFLGGTPLCLTVTSSYNLDLKAGPLDPGEIINCTLEAPAST